MARLYGRSGTVFMSGDKLAYRAVNGVLDIPDHLVPTAMHAGFSAVRPGFLGIGDDTEEPVTPVPAPPPAPPAEPPTGTEPPADPPADDHAAVPAPSPRKSLLDRIASRKAAEEEHPVA